MTKNKPTPLAVLILLVATVLPIFAGGKAEEAPAPEVLEPMVLNVGVLKGPSGFGIIKLVEETASLGEGVEVRYQVLPSPAEMVARMASKEIQAALLPLNVAAKLYTKGAGYPLAAIPGRGSLYILSRDPEVRNWEDLAGKTVYAVGKGATPDYLFHYYLAEKGIDAADVTLDFSIPAPQLTQMAVAGKADTLLLPQPFAALVQLQAKDVEVRLDFQDTWRELQGGDEAYPITAFVVDPSFAAGRPDAYAALLAAYEESISWVLSRPAEAAQLIEKHGILGAGPARAAIPDCGLDFIDAAAAKEEVEAYLRVLLEADPVSVGESCRMRDSTLPPRGAHWPTLRECPLPERLRRALFSAAGILFLLLLWKGIALAVGSEILVPPPESAFHRLFLLLPEGRFWASLGATAVRALYGFFISFAAGLAVGIGAGVWPPFHRLVKPLLSMLRAMPVMSVILLGMLWFVTDLVPVFVTFLMVFPLVCANVLEGVLQIDRRLLEMGRVYRLTKFQRLVHILLPSLVPFLLAAANAGLGMAWKVTIAAEVLCQPRNAVGTGIQYAQLNLEIAEVMAWTAAAVLLSSGTEHLLGALERILPWRRGVR